MARQEMLQRTVKPSVLVDINRIPDLDRITLVVNYDIPEDGDTYRHRAGRRLYPGSRSAPPRRRTRRIRGAPTRPPI